MKKKITFIVGIVVLLAIIGGITFSAYRSSETYRTAKAAITWDCSIAYAEKSDD